MNKRLDPPEPPAIKQIYAPNPFEDGSTSATVAQTRRKVEDDVWPGGVVMTLTEAKSKNTVDIKSPGDGFVKSFNVSEGDTVGPGDKLCELLIYVDNK